MYMSIRAYLDFVELPTKIASVIPFFMGVVYSLYRYDKVDVLNLAIMFIAMLSFDMATTAINNYCDYINELRYHKNKYTGKNPMFVYEISSKVALYTISILLLISILLGIILTLRTNLLLLVLGAICFVIGIFYTFGPIPISRMPLGEVFSGVFMGLFIPFLTIYVSNYSDGNFGIYIDGLILSARFNILEAIIICIVTVPLIGGIANIMLANNICDLDEDIKVGRYTLPYYIGKSRAIALYKFIYYAGYLVTMMAIFVGILPISSILFFLSLFVVQKNIKLFEVKQVKSQTFITSVKNFTIIGILYVFCIVIGLL